MVPHDILWNGHRSHSYVAMRVMKTQSVLLLCVLLGVTHSPSTDFSWLNASNAPLSWHPGQPAAPGVESWWQPLRSHLSHWDAFYHIPAPTQTSSSNYWNKFLSNQLLKRSKDVLVWDNNKIQKFFHIRSKSHCAIEVHNNWQMPKPIIAPTAMTKIITAFPSVKCLPCSVSYLK